MGAENVDHAAQAVEANVKASGERGVTTEVRTQIDNAITGNGVTTREDIAALSQKLEQSGVLPKLLLDKDGVDAFFKKYGDGNQQIGRTTLEDIASGKTRESAYNRLLAQAMLNRYNDIDREARNYGAQPGQPNTRLSRNEVASWARRQTMGDRFTPEIDQNGATWISQGARLIMNNGRFVELRSFSGGSNDFGADGQDKVAKYGYTKINGRDTLTSIEITGGVKYESRDGVNWTRNGEPVQNFRMNPDGTFSFDRRLADGTQVRTTHNANHSEVSVDMNGKVRQVRYADGSTRDIEYGADGRATKIVETGRDGKKHEYTRNPADPQGNWLVDGKPAKAGERTFREPRVAENGDFRYVAPDGRTPMIQSTDGLVRRDPNPTVERPTTPGLDPPAAAPRTDFRLGADTVRVTKEGENITRVERTNPSGEREVITRNADGSYTIQRTGRDGSVTTEQAKPGTFKMGTDGSYEYQTLGGATVRQNADGSREYTDPSGARTRISYDATTGMPTKIERTVPDGRGGTTETLTFQNGKWVLSRNSYMGGEVSDVRINSDGSYSYKFQDRVITQETTRNIREIKDNSGTTRIGFNNEGQPEFVRRTTRDAQGKEHVEELKTSDGGKTWNLTIDGQPVKTKDIKVNADGSYEYTREDGVKIRQHADGSRSETRALQGGGERTVTRKPDGTTEIQTTRADGSTSTLYLGRDGKPVKIVEKNKDGSESVIEKGPDGQWKKTTTDKDGKKTEVKVSEPRVNPDGSFSYDQEFGKRGRKMTVNDDGSKSYKVSARDNLWSISADLLEERLGRKPTGREILAMIKQIAAANNIRNANIIRTGATLRI